MAGVEIFKKRHQLRAFNTPSDEHNQAFKTMDYQVTHECESHPLESIPSAYVHPSERNDDTMGNSSRTSYPKYNVKITAAPRPARLRHTSTEYKQQRKNRAAMEANRAAFAYTKVASLFFVSLLVTWVPSSINRVYSLIYPHSISIPYAYAAGVVLSLMGFWNSVIYITTSRAACKTLFSNIFRKLGGKGGGRSSNDGDGPLIDTTYENRTLEEIAV